MATNTNPFYTYSATAGSSKTLQKPQDGGDNNQWGNYINTDLDEIVAAVNALSDKIADANEKTLIEFTATGSAVNHVEITNAAAGNGPTISAAGSESDVDLNVTAKGTGDINLTPGTNGDVNIPASKGITFGDDGEKIEGDGTDLTIASSATLNVNTGSASGNDLKVNTSQLVVEGDTGNVGINNNDPSGTANSEADNLVIGSTGTTRNGLTVLGSQVGTIAFGDSVDNNVGRVTYNHTSELMQFHVNDSERMRIESGGDVTVNTGNLVIGTAGKGITFQDTDSSNDSTTANEAYTLSSYEEGTFSPTVSSTSGTITTVSANGFYRKIGTTVICFIDFTVTTNGTGSGLGTISGLPFTTTASSESSGSMRIDGFNGATASYTLDKSTNSLVLSKYDNTYPFGNNARGTLIVPYIVA